jgi:hypothetical protein
MAAESSAGRPVAAIGNPTDGDPETNGVDRVSVI